MGHMKFIVELAEDKDALADFRAAYEQAVKDKKEQYLYNNSYLYTQYAGHVLYYVDNYAKDIIRSESRERQITKRTF